jgi:hypothetical protein
MAGALNLPFLGAIPIHPQMRINCDRGKPLDNWKVSDDLSQAIDTMCGKIAQQISIATMSGKYVQPTLSVS